jgi:hypothetical protein
MSLKKIFPTWKTSRIILPASHRIEVSSRALKIPAAGIFLKLLKVYPEIKGCSPQAKVTMGSSFSNRCLKIKK